jgi:tetratricopeptide (TPR) repeat protein
VLGSEHPNTATSLNNLGSLLQVQGDLAGAKPYLERALAISEAVLGPQHPYIATGLNNLGLLFQAQGDTLYLATEVAGQAQATLDAKHRDMQSFLAFNYQLYGHDRPEEWFVSATKAFLKHLRGQRFAQVSLVRIYATVRHFARWLDRKFPDLFPLGCPTEGIKPPAEPEANW